MKKIAFFDFDGTITKKDTLLEFIRFSKGNFSFFLGFLINLPYLFAYKLKIISNQTAKEKVLQSFFRNLPEDHFNLLCKSFSERRLPQLIRYGALNEIERLKKEGYTVVIVSASPESWILYWTCKMDVQLIASRLQIENGVLTGKLTGKNCHGEEKVDRIKNLYCLSNYDDIIAYGDTKGDRPMLSLAKSQFFKPFR